MKHKQLEKILSCQTNIRSLLFYGRMDEQIIAPDSIIYPFRKYLSCILHNAGMDNVVFYDATNTEGKYVLDKKSAYYSFGQNRSTYIKRYGAAPDGTVPELPQATQPDFHVAEYHDAQQELLRQEDGLIFQLREMQPESFYAELTAFMENTDFRSAVIITNFFDTITNGEKSFARRLQVIVNQLLEGQRINNKNLLIFLEPDIHDSLSSEHFADALAGSSLRDRFMILNSHNTWELDPNRTFYIGRPGSDELTSLLVKYSITPVEGTRLIPDDDTEKLGEALLFHLLDGAERARAEGRAVRDVNLRDIIEQIETVMDNHDGDLHINLQNISMFSMYPSAQEADPAEKLRSTKGWEPVAEPIFAALDRFARLHPEYAQQNEASAPASPVVVSRLSPHGSRSYPPASQLPHVMLVGDVGVGKSTIARLLGQIYFRNNMLKVGHTVEAKASDLISDVLGGTAKQVTALLRSAEGGVLFIDEAYDLYASHTERSSGTCYKAEAITALVQALTNPNHHFLLVLAGYADSAPDAHDGVESLFEMNAGLRSRIPVIAKIPAYSPELLAEIAVRTLKQHGCSLSDTVTQDGLKRYFEYRLRTCNRRDWGNARSAIRAMEKPIDSCLLRTANESVHAISPEDFAAEEREYLSGGEKDLGAYLASIEQQYPGIGKIFTQIAESAIARERSARKRAAKRRDTHTSGVRQSRLSKHIILKGGVGTGKTTIAKLLPKAMGACDLMSGADAVCLDDPQGLTAQRLSEAIYTARALNTVLLIDEAYALPEDRVTQLLSPMTEYDDLLVIFNVYPSEMEQFKRKNQGLVSRCDVYEVSDYTPEQLAQIMDRFCEREGYSLDETCKSDLQKVYERWYALRDVTPEYGNAREVQNLFLKLTGNCDRRMANDPDADFIITKEDIPQPEQEIIRLSKHSNKLEDVLAELDGYVGMNDLRDFITHLAKAQRYNKFMGLPSDDGLPSFLFVGPPGTGKTTGAELFAHALYAMGALQTPKFTAISARDLIAGYVGQTAEKAHDVLYRNARGVILIDEAYMLSSTGGNANDDFRAEAVAQLLLFMERERGKTVVIFAGYPKQMEQFVDSNPGLASRIGSTLEFPPYTEDECLEILRRMLHKLPEHFTLSSAAEKKARERIKALMLTHNFGNARAMRNLADAIYSAHKSRIVRLLTADPAATPEALEAYTITPEDIPG